MSIPSNRALRRDFETIFRAGTLAGLSDGELLHRFVVPGGGGDEAEAAFALLIERHGAMVLSVCRGVLRDAHEAEDAFQATFLILLRRAAAIRRRESVGPWLHGVAHRVATCARAASARRRGYERRWVERSRAEGEPSHAEEPIDLDLSAMLHAEVGRLPEHFRAPIVLCDLEGLPVDEVARQLGWPAGTVKSRLHRGRLRLRDRLIRRGVAPAVAAGCTAARVSDALGSVAPTLVEATARMMAVAKGTGAGGVPAAVMALVEGVGGMMLMTRGTVAAIAAIVLSLGLAAIGLAGGPRRGEDAKKEPAVAAAAAPVTPVAPIPAQAAPVRVRRPPRPDDLFRIETITVNGRAADAKGRPVAGAMVYVIDNNDQRNGDMPILLATATTGPDGRYVARNVELPVWKPRPVSPIGEEGVTIEVSAPPAVEQGIFQVAATGPGFGFTWHRIACYRPGERPGPAAAASSSKADNLEAFYRGEPIAQELNLGPPASLRGRAVDDLGRPLAGARVRVGVVDYGAAGPAQAWSCSRIQAVREIPFEHRAFSGIRALPEALRSTRTGPDGSYRIDGLPREAEFLVEIDPGGAYAPFLATVGTTVVPVRELARAVTKLRLTGVRYLGHDAVLDPTFTAPRAVRFLVRSAETGRPVRGATVRATTDHEELFRAPSGRPPGGRAGEILDGVAEVLDLVGLLGDDFEWPTWESMDWDPIRSGGVGIADAEGRATLHLRPGDYGYAIEPGFEDIHLPARGSFHVGDEPTAAVDDVKLAKGAIVDLQARDATTGSGIEGVSFQYQSGASHLRREVRSRPAFVDHPRTDREGRLRAVVAPGPLRIYVADVPPAWKLEGSPVAPVVLAAGSETVIAWRFARLPEPNAVGGSNASPFPAELVAVWRAQERRVFPGKFRVRHYTVDLDRSRVPAEQLAAYLDANDLAKVADPAAALAERFPAMPDGAWQTYTIIDDGRRRRNTHRFPTLQERDDVTVANGREVVEHLAANGQVNIYDDGDWRAVVLGLREFCAWPAAGKMGDASGVIRRDEAAGRLTVERTGGDLVERWVVDRRTGFVAASSTRPAKAGSGGYLVRQYGPKEHGEGVVLPTVHVRVDMSKPDRDGLLISVIEGVELGYRPSPLDFMVTAPAGATVIDGRSGQSPSGQSVASLHTTRYPVADVVAFADGERPVTPVLTIGERAPAIRPERWLDRADGPTDPPELAGKVVLVGFGGIAWAISPTSQPTLPPEFEVAAEHLGGRIKDLVIVGLQGSGGYVTAGLDERTDAFLQQRGIAYLQPVDRAAGEPGWLGATFRDYGIRGGPAFAVIDRAGNVAYVGQDQAEAMKEAEKRLGP